MASTGLNTHLCLWDVLRVYQAHGFHYLNSTVSKPPPPEVQLISETNMPPSSNEFLLNVTETLPSRISKHSLSKAYIMPLIMLLLQEYHNGQSVFYKYNLHQSDHNFSLYPTQIRVRKLGN